MLHKRGILFCALLLSVCLSALAALAGDDTVSYAVDGGNLYFLPDTGVIVDADQTVTAVSIPAGIGGVPVTAIGSKAFSNCAALTDVTFPDSVTAIGTKAFAGCTGLTEIALPAKLETLGAGAFSNCESLASLWVPVSLTAVKTADYTPSAFGGCPLLKEITFEDGITAIPGHLFTSCTGLESLVIPDTVTKIGYNSFGYCTSLREITLPQGLITIDSHAFTKCSSLTEITLPSGLETLGNEAFSGCSSLSRVVFLGEVPAFDQSVFEDTAPEIAFLSAQDGAALLAVEIVDAQTLAPLENAAVRVYDSDGILVTTGTTDGVGVCSFYLAEGAYSLSASAGYGYKTRTAQWTSGAEETLTIGLTQTELVSVAFTQHEMTMEEMEQAGIDTEASANQQVFAYEIELEYSAHLTIPFKSYINNEHEVKLSTAAGVAVDWGEPLEVQAPYEGDGVLTSGGSAKQTVRIYPISEQFYLIIWGRDTWLKEMFHVQMLVINQSKTDTLTDCVCSLELPDGLSLAAVEGDRNPLNVGLGTVASGGSAVIDWYVRGDAEGSYAISASLSGIFMPVQEPFAYQYTCEEPIEVLAGSALQLTLSIESAAYNGQAYPVELELKNTSDKTLYNVTHRIEAVREWQLVAVDFSMREFTEEDLLFETLGDEASVTVRELLPGETVTISMTIPIKFSSILESISSLGSDLGTSSSIAAILSGGEAALAVKIVSKVLSLIKVEYLLKSATVTTLDGSTTEIPVTIQVLPADKAYLRRTWIAKEMMSLTTGLLSKFSGTGTQTFGKLLNYYGNGWAVEAHEIKALNDQEPTALLMGQLSEVPVSVGECVNYTLHIPRGEATLHVDEQTELQTADAKRSLLPHACAAQAFRARAVITPLEGAQVNIHGNTATVTGGDAEITLYMLEEGEAYMTVETEDSLSAVRLITSDGICVSNEEAGTVDTAALAVPRVTLVSQTGEFTVHRALVEALLYDDAGSLKLETPEQTVILQWYSLLALGLEMGEEDALRLTLTRDGGTIALRCETMDGDAVDVTFPGDAYLIFSASGDQSYVLPEDTLREDAWISAPVRETGTLVTIRAESMSILNQIGLAGLGVLAVIGLVWLFRRKR